MLPESIDVIALGATGYAGGELLRLVAGHPRLSLGAAVSGSRAGDPVASVFPHLSPAFSGTSFTFAQDLASRSWVERPVAVVSAAPHGASASLVARTLAVLREQGANPYVVDLSADFRHDAATFEAVYGSAHPEPELLAEFACGLPDIDEVPPGRFVGEPGCFTTAVVLAAAPLIASGRFEPTVRVSAVTGSTGSGRTPAAGTHHPVRQSNLWGYKALRHRHAPEMEGLLGRHGTVSVQFVPHSGPFSRGIHATLFLTANAPTSADAVRSTLAEFYAHSPFVGVAQTPPTLKQVVGTNRCELGVAVEGRQVVVFSAIDNLLKGASGGAVQWLNRMAGWPVELGLTALSVPWG